ncbi:MAG: hypothetical protein HQL72_02285 [Magnetococcales bacterium]|nr:hypothetical protein [Magnetococcales bacterium]
MNPNLHQKSIERLIKRSLERLRHGDYWVESYLSLVGAIDRRDDRIWTANSLNPILSIASDAIHPTIRDLEKIKGERFVYYPD